MSSKKELEKTEFEHALLKGALIGNKVGIAATAVVMSGTGVGLSSALLLGSLTLGPIGAIIGAAILINKLDKK